MTNNTTQPFAFLPTHSETGRLIRGIDWAATSLGAPAGWPQSLRTALGIVLHSGFPMVLFWGDELVFFYNDSYRVIMDNGLHPAIGKKTGDLDSDTWDFPVSQLRKVFTTDEPLVVEDIKVTRVANGNRQDAYRSFSYSPVKGENGKNEGVLVQVLDTTAQAKLVGDLREEERKVRSMIEEANVATALMVGRDMKVEIANELMITTWGKGRSVMGKPLAEALPELEGQPFLEVLDNVFTTGIPYEAKAMPALLEVDGVLGTYYFDFAYKAIRDSKGNIYGVMDIATDVTEQVLLQKALRESRDKLELAIDATELATWDLNPKTLVFTANDRLKDWFGLDKEKQTSLNEAILSVPEEDRHRVKEAMEAALVYHSGGHYFAEHRLVNRITQQERIVRAKGVVNFDDQQQPVRFIGTIIDITAEVKARREIEESEARFKSLLEQAPVAMLLLKGDDLVLELANEAMLDLMGRDKSVLGKPILEFMPELEGQEVMDIMRNVYRTGVSHYVYDSPVTVIKNGSPREGYYTVSYVPMKENGQTTGVMEVALEVTESVIAKQKIENSRNELLSSFNDAPVAIALIAADTELTFRIVNQRYAELVGKTQGDIVGKPLLVALPDIKGQGFDTILNDVIRTGHTFISNEHPVNIVVAGVPKTLILNFTYQPMLGDKGDITGVLAVVIDVTEQVISRRMVEAKERELRDLITASPIGICVVSGSPVRVEEVNDRFELISGKSREQFMSAPYWEVLREAASRFEPVMEQVFATGVKFTTEETEVTLLRDGTEENVFLTFQYIPVKDKDNRVTKVMVMAIEVTHQVEVRKEIEAAVARRTKELAALNLSLKRSNEELEQFAYIASHDLQEPVRKISTFTQLLELSLPEVSPKAKDYFQKIYGSTDRMAKLIRDVLAFSQVTSDPEKFVRVDLNSIIKGLEQDFEVAIAQTHATLIYNRLPEVMGVPSQLNQLFGNLLSNSLKYIHPGIAPKISISAEPATKEMIARHPNIVQNGKYYVLSFRDNGIGFDEEHADRIFKIFQRLHGKDQFAGTGIGLSIVRKIVLFHGGHISAKPGKNGGAQFDILLPYSAPAGI